MIYLQNTHELLHNKFTSNCCVENNGIKFQSITYSLVVVYIPMCCCEQPTDRYLSDKHQYNT